ncbi:MAG TPA: hypothetical protein VGI39_25475 [Polyangiaceae bacterium]|jgi:hypothetical protein
MADRGARTPGRSAAARAFRFLRIGLGAALGLEVFYLVVMNVFLWTPLFGKVVNATPEDVDIHYRRAWSLYPTHVTARDLSIRGTDSHVEWILHLDEVTFDCSLLELPTQHFHVTRARGSGIRFRLRFTTESPRATPAYLAQIPPIDSLGPLAFKPSGPPYKGEWSDADWHLWTIRLDDIVAEHVHEVWLDRGRFVGDARIGGGFYLRPIRRVEVGPLDVEVRGGAASFAARTVADPLVLRGTMRVAPFDPRVASGDDLLHHLSIDVDAKATIPDVAALPVDLPPEAKIAGALELPRVALKLARGVVQNGTHVEARSDQLEARLDEHAASGAAGLSADVKDGELRARLDVTGVDFDHAIRAPALSLTADGRALDLAQGFDDLHATLDVPEVELADLRALGAPELDRGSVRASAHVEGWRSDARLAGEAEAHATRAALHLGKARIHGAADARLRVESFYVRQMRLVGARLELNVPEAGAAVGLGRGDVARVRDAAVLATSEDMDPRDPLASIRVHADLPRIDLYDREAARDALGLGGAVRLATGHAGLGASADVNLLGDRSEGRAVVKSANVTLRRGGIEVTLDVSARARAHGLDWHSGSFTLDEAYSSLSKVAVATRGSAPALSARRATVAASSPRLDPSDLLARLQVIGTMSGGEVLRPASLLEFAPDAPSFVLGAGASFDADAAATITRHVAHGSASLFGHALSIRMKKLRLEGDAAVTADVARWDLATNQLDGEARATLNGVHGGFDPTKSDAAFLADDVEGRARVRDLRLDSPSLEAVDYDLHVGHAVLKDAAALDTFLPDPDILTLESGRATLSGDFGSARDHRARGRLDLHIEDAGVRMHKTRFRGDFALTALGRSEGKAGDALDLGGSTLRMRNIAVRGSFADTSAWSGDLVLEEGTLRLSPEPRLEGDFALDARDARPILDVLLRDSAPGVLADLTRMPRLTAFTHLRVQPQTLGVTDLSAAGGDLSLRGIYVVKNADRRAAFVVEKGPLSAGIRIDNDGPHLRLFGLRGWYREQRSAAAKELQQQDRRSAASPSSP